MCALVVNVNTFYRIASYTDERSHRGQQLMGQVCTLYACCFVCEGTESNESTKVPNPQCIGFEHGGRLSALSLNREYGI